MLRNRIRLSGLLALLVTLPAAAQQASIQTLGGCIDVQTPLLLPVEGLPIPGDTLFFQVQRESAVPAVMVRLLSDKLIAPNNVPCGTIIPGIGELYVDLGSTSQIQAQGVLTDQPEILPLTLPNKPSLIGLDFVVQVALVESTLPGEPNGIELTNGLLLTIGT